MPRPLETIVGRVVIGSAIGTPSVVGGPDAVPLHNSTAPHSLCSLKPPAVSAGGAASFSAKTNPRVNGLDTADPILFCGWMRINAVTIGKRILPTFLVLSTRIYLGPPICFRAAVRCGKPERLVQANASDVRAITCSPKRGK